MQHLFSDAGTLAIGRLAQRKVLLAFDFDGTLAPIVARPDDARVPAHLVRCMQALSQRWPVAVITGRQVSDLMPRLGFQPGFVVGNHGAEGLTWQPTGTAMQDMRERLGRLDKPLREAGVQVEDKGLSLALHFRLAPDRERALSTIDRLIRELPSGLKTLGGKSVCNIVFADAPDKGDAAVELLRRSGSDSLLFIGDDLNDEAVFSRASPDWVTVRIGPGDEASNAIFFLDDHAEMREALERILGALGPAPADCRPA